MLLFPRQEAAVDSSGLPVPVPRVKKRLSGSFPGHTESATDESSHQQSTRNVTEPPVALQSKRKSEAKDKGHYGSSQKNAASACEAEVYNTYLALDFFSTYLTF